MTELLKEFVVVGIVVDLALGVNILADAASNSVKEVESDLYKSFDNEFSSSSSSSTGITVVVVVDDKSSTTTSSPSADVSVVVVDELSNQGMNFACP